MSRDYWRELVRLYANGRKICNCGDAYAKEDGRCEYGCSAAQIFTREDIAKKVLKDHG